ncbi:hypothetical protein [Methylophaga sp.]|uniref:hypothetical protein n=1 Tax=Methylophaga sp. TaxID=2024840 RepID=UPI003A91095A
MDDKGRVAIVKSSVVQKDPQKEALINKLRYRNSRFLRGAYPALTNSTLPYQTAPKQSSISFVGDGTGFGKSYGIFNEFVRHQPVAFKKDFMALYFITPQKSQIDISSQTLEIARQRGIRIIPVMAITTDARDLDFINWITGKTNREVFMSWSSLAEKLLKTTKNPKEIEILQAIKGVRFFVEKIDLELKAAKQASIDNDDEAKQVHEQDAARERDKLFKHIRQVAELVINIDTERGIMYFAEMAEKKASNLSQHHELMLEVLGHYAPFDLARIGTCVLVSTASKFETGTHVSRLSKRKADPKQVFSTSQIDDLIGQKRDYKPPKRPAVDIHPDIETEKEKNEFIKSRYLIHNAENCFSANNISFIFAVDEEHETYGKMLAGCRSTVLSDAPVVGHVCSAFFRISQDAKDSGREYAPTYELSKTLVDNINDSLSRYCDLAPGITLDSVLSLFKNSISGFYIDAGSVDQVASMVGSAFNFSAKRFINEKPLKRAKLMNPGESTANVKIYYSGEDTKDVSLYDFYQVILAILHVCSNMGSEYDEYLAEITGSTEIGSNHQAQGNTQYEHLLNFIRGAKRNRQYINEAITRPDYNDPVIDYFYVYFYPKVVLSVKKRDHTRYKWNYMHGGGFVEVNVNLDIVTTLPEAMLLKIAYKTNNQVLLMSATSSFRPSYNSSFNRECLDYFAGVEVFDIPLRTRGDYSTRIMHHIREKRLSMRGVELAPLSDDLSGTMADERCLKTFKIWKQKLGLANYKQSKFKQREYARNLAGLINAAYSGNNTMILSISNDFKSILKDYIRSCDIDDVRCKFLNRDPAFKGHDNILLFKPFNDKYAVRIVLFDAAVAADGIAKEACTLNTKDAGKVCLSLVSSFISAGTGLNNVVIYDEINGKRHTHHEIDFDTLIITGSPFYSVVKSKDEGYQTFDNQLTCMKYIAGNGLQVRLSDLNQDAFSPTHPNYFKVIQQEHQFLLASTIMQSVGRVERRDAIFNTTLLLDDAVLEDMALKFSDLERNPVNHTQIQSISALNYVLKQEAETYRKTFSFSSDGERLVMEEKTKDEAELINHFFSGDYLDFLRDARRKGDKDAISFNERLRDITSVTNPQSYIDSLMASPLIASDPFRRSVVEAFYFSPKERFGLDRVYIKENAQGALTDMEHGHIRYSPVRMAVPHAGHDDHENEVIYTKDYPSLDKRMKTLSKASSALDELLPNLAIMPLLKGNVGEYLFDGYINDVLKDEEDGVVVDATEIPTSLHSELYELFDRYIISGNRLLCVDVKNWSSQGTQGKSIESFLSRVEQKVSQVRQLMSQQYERIDFAYVNTFTRQNHSTSLSENEIDGVHFYNLFRKNEKGYRPLDRQEAKDRGYDHLLDSDFGVNGTLTKLLKG